jgi:hypothetical protein
MTRRATERTDTVNGQKFVAKTSRKSRASPNHQRKLVKKRAQPSSEPTTNRGAVVEQSGRSPAKPTADIRRLESPASHGGPDRGRLSTVALSLAQFVATRFSLFDGISTPLPPMTVSGVCAEQGRICAQRVAAARANGHSSARARGSGGRPDRRDRDRNGETQRTLPSRS